VAIKNTGLAEADDINWQITLDGGLILLGKETTGTIQTIPIGGEEEVRSGLIFGFGQTRVTVTADILEGSGIRNQGAFVLLFFISVLPGGG
ncbi:MAG: Zn-dependent exopeptidase M28, partial [Thermoplasmatales archaeon]|nr:Zn-dependent exopeptidase M28 [Thermoplasmatales archaeon]